MSVLNVQLNHKTRLVQGQTSSFLLQTHICTRFVYVHFQRWTRFSDKYFSI